MEIVWQSLLMGSSACMQFPKCCAVCVHPHVYVPQGVYVCCHCVVCVCVWVTRAPASCCSACINTLLGLSKLSVNWGGKSLCAALFSHVTYPVCSGKQECKLWNLLTFTNKQRYIHTHTQWKKALLRCYLSYDSFCSVLIQFFYSCCCISPSFTLSVSFFQNGSFHSSLVTPLVQSPLLHFLFLSYHRPLPSIPLPQNALFPPLRSLPSPKHSTPAPRLSSLSLLR